MNIIRIICLLFVYCSLVYGECHFHTDIHTQSLIDKMNKWNIYQTFSVSYDGATYSVGLCQSPNNSSAAIVEQRSNATVVLGRLDQVNVVGDDNWIQLTYEGGEKYNNQCDNNSRSASIMLVCGTNKNNLTVLQVTSDADAHCNYMFKLQVQQLCPTVESNKKLSGGAIFLIIFFSLATIYLVGGGIYMHVKRGARGLEHIPNLEMWRKLGNLAADGCDFCCRCERSTSRAGYFLAESGADVHSVDDDILAP